MPYFSDRWLEHLSGGFVQVWRVLLHAGSGSELKRGSSRVSLPLELPILLCPLDQRWRRVFFGLVARGNDDLIQNLAYARHAYSAKNSQ